LYLERSGGNIFAWDLSGIGASILIMADDETTANTSPPPAVDATTAATTAAAAATSWFDSLGVDIGKALETAREQVVKAAEVRN